MKMIIAVALALVAFAVAAPHEGPEIEVIENIFEASADGYRANVKLSNGIEQGATGTLQEARNEDGDTVKVLVVKGLYTQLDENGQPQVIEYLADENGFQARGPQIPVAEPVSQ